MGAVHGSRAARPKYPRGSIWGWLAWALLLAVAVANLLLVHPVPALAYAVVSLVYLPAANRYLGSRFGFSIHPLLKIALAVVAVLFTLGVSDLGDIID